MAQASVTRRRSAPSWWRAAPRRALVLTVLVCAGAVAALARALYRVLADPHGGLDFLPVYGAGMAVGDHRPLYEVPNFVYPPVAAFVAEPLSVLPLRQAFWVWTVLATLALVATCAAAVSLTRRASTRWSLASTCLTAALVLVLFSARPTLRSLDLGNASLFLPLTIVVVCWCWGATRWHAGTALLVASLVVKPVLLPLVFVPVLLCRWRALLVWGLVGALALALALEASSGVGGIPDVVDGLLHATHFTGRDAPLNLSLAGFVGVHPALAPMLTGARVAVVAIAAAGVLAWMFSARTRSARRGVHDPVAGTVGQRAGLLLVASTTLLVALFLAGSISEVHYLLILVPALVVVGSSRRAVPVGLSIAASLAFVAAKSSGPHVSTQELLVAMEVLTLLACTVLLALESGLAPARGQQPLSAAAGTSSAGAPASARESRRR